VLKLSLGQLLRLFVEERFFVFGTGFIVLVSSKLLLPDSAVNVVILRQRKKVFALS
jgi:hypothetical protein